MKRGLNICCGVLALALLFGCAQSVPQQEQEPKAEPVAAGAFAAEVEPEYLQHAAYMSAPKGFFWTRSAAPACRGSATGLQSGGAFPEESAGKRLCGRFPGGVVLWGGLRGGSFF